VVLAGCGVAVLLDEPLPPPRTQATKNVIPTKVLFHELSFIDRPLFLRVN